MAIPLIAWGVTALAGYVTKKVCDTVIESKKVSGSSNPPTNTQYQGESIVKSSDKKLENLDKEIADRIREQLEGLSPRERREKLEEIKGMSKAEKAELLRDLKDENLREQQTINKELQNKLDKQDKRSIQLAKELQEAKNNNDPAKVAQVAQMIKDNDKNQQATRLVLKKNEEEAKKQAKALEEYFKLVEQNKPWYLDMNFGSPWLWGILIFACLVFYFSFRGFLWCWNFVKPFLPFTSKNSE